MTPLIAVTLSYCAGVLLGLRTGVPAPVLLIVIPCTALLFVWRRRHAVALAFVLAGTCAGAIRHASAASDCRERLSDGAAVRLTGVPLVVTTEGVSLPVRADVRTPDGACGVLTVRVHAGTPHQALLDSAARGRTPAVVLIGRWLPHPRRNGWPRPPEYAGGVLVDTVQAAPLTDSPTSVSVRAGVLTRVRTAQQARLRALLPQRWGLAEALLLAQKAGVDPDTRRRWVAAGLVHLLAISGMHVGLIASGVLLLAGALGVPPRSARRVALALTAAYVLFLGAPSAALRALLQATLLLGSLELQRPAEPFTGLAAAALFIVVLEPLALLDPGFQLSFAGMMGLIGWRGAVSAALPPWLPRSLRAALGAGVAASALTTPIAALHFGTASWIGVVATVVAVPVLSAAIALLLVALVWSAVTGSVTGVHALAADVPLRLLDAIAEGAARIPGGHGFVAATTVMAALAAFAVALLVRSALRARASELPPPSDAPDAAHDRYAQRHRRRRVRLGVAGASALVIVTWLPLIVRPHDGHVEIHAIDVGQGDALAIRTPGGRWILVDAGPRTARFDAGRDRVVPYLLRRGARRIDALILTHPNADHIGGAAAVLEAFDVALVIDPGLAAGKDLFIDLLSAARQSHRRWIAGRADIAFAIDDVEIALLYPLPVLDGAANANDNSVVFRLSYGRFAALFLGDAPVSVEEQLVARHGARLAAPLLKVGHHGSNTSTGDALLYAARPTVAIVSAGRNNRYGHPAPAVLRRLGVHEVRVLRTDQLGSVMVRADRGGSIEVLAR